MKVVLSIAGSDSGGGAGIQADIKTFEAFGVFGTTVITVLTAQNTQGVNAVYPISSEFIKEQLKTVFDDFEISAVKIGMLFSNEIIDTVREFIKDLDIPIVFDPVFISKAGSKLLNDDAVENLKTLLPYVTITTPNLYEAEQMFGYQTNNDNLVKEIDSTTAVLIKKHINEDQKSYTSIDILYQNGKKQTFDTPYKETNNTHGTGCSFSSAIAANLALECSLEEAIEKAKGFIYYAIKNGPKIGHGKSPIAHKVGGELCHLK